MLKNKKYLRILTLIIVLVMVVGMSFSYKRVNKTKNKIWYKQPATKWMEALPVGNGRLGAMVFGDPKNERIQLNEDSMWSGGPDWGNSKGNVEDLKVLRKLITDGDIPKADQFIVDEFSYKTIRRSHQTMGDLYIDLDNKKINDYSRSLDLDNALIRIKYNSDGSEVTEKVFSSFPDNVLMVELETKNKKGLNFSLKLDRPEDKGHKTVQITTASDNELIMEGEATQFGGLKNSNPFPIDYGVKFETRLKVKNKGGSITAKNGKLLLKGVQKATLYIVCETSFYHTDYKKINAAHAEEVYQKSFEELFQRHITDYQKLFNRVSLDLGGQELNSIPTDKRLEKIKKGEADLDMIAKLFQYGRYLLISSSRPNTNPANLQGIWNDHIEAPWNADYHLNINLQMNYWPAEVANLHESHEPLFDFIDRLVERGRITAKEQYGINRGSMMHHATDLWAPTFMRAEKPYWGSWVHGGGWIVQHYWEAYQFNRDKYFLKSRAYPAIKACAEFYLDWLVKDNKDGTWVSSPETSPENSYWVEDGEKGSVSYGSAMGHQIIAEVFDNTLEAAKILNINDDFIKEVQSKRKTLHTGLQIGPDGRLLEWNKPYKEVEKGHRHMSHLFALHPGNDITKNTPELFDAAKKTIDFRLEHGGAGTGWSRAWMINFNARLLDQKSASENIKNFLQISVADNLFDEHPPFQIDGNFGFTAGIAELLLQSHEGFIRILPAMPLNWKNGHVSGLKARGNIEVDIEWKDGKLYKLGLKSNIDKKEKIVYQNLEKEINLKNNQFVWLDENMDPLN